jgi:cGMP-dependent protein kinase 2
VPHSQYALNTDISITPQVPENMLNNKHFATSPEIAYHRAMVLTNNQLHRLTDVDDSMSGTTAITVLVRGRNVYVANVGDSRAVLAERQGNRVVAQDLSFDQTPFRCMVVVL